MVKVPIKASSMGKKAKPKAGYAFSLRVRDEGARYCTVWLTSKHGAIRCGCLHGVVPSEVAEALVAVWPGEVIREPVE